MVILILGISERKYSHWRGTGQRLIRTSLLLIKRSTERLTLTGTKSEPPCCSARQWSTCYHEPLFPQARQLAVYKSVHLLTSKLILAVNGSSKLSSKPSSLLKTCRSEWSELRMNSFCKCVRHVHFLNHILHVSDYFNGERLKCQSILFVSHIRALKDLGALECLQANAG